MWCNVVLIWIIFVRVELKIYEVMKFFECNVCLFFMFFCKDKIDLWFCEGWFWSLEKDDSGRWFFLCMVCVMFGFVKIGMDELELRWCDGFYWERVGFWFCLVFDEW